MADLPKQIALFVLPIVLACGLTAGEAKVEIKPSAVRIKDVADIQGVRDNQLIGQGLVVGLNGTGDKTGNHAPQVLENFVNRMGLNIPAASLKPKNIAVVAVTATLPPYAKKGTKLDVQVSSLGDATSLQGGILLQTPLIGGDGRVYLVSQGALSIGGFTLDGGGGTGSVTKNHPLVGRVPNGGLVEREVEMSFSRGGTINLLLRSGDFTSAQRMAACINARWKDSAHAVDASSVAFLMPFETIEKASPVDILAELENLRFVPDFKARIVINERTGTVVAGSDVRISPTVLCHGNMYISIKHTPVVSQPAPLSNGTTETVTETTRTVEEEDAQAAVFGPGPTLGELASALNALKIKPRDIIAIFQALKEAGALNAELIIM